MKGTLINTSSEPGVPPRLRFEIEVENESRDHVVWVFAWSGEVYIPEPRLSLGRFETEFRREQFQPLQRQCAYFYLDMDHRKLERVEEERKGSDLRLDIDLNLLQVSFATSNTLPSVMQFIQTLKGNRVSVYSPGWSIARIPKSEWEEKLLEGLSYGRIEYIELYLPPPPLGTQLDKALNYLKKAKEDFNANEYPDVLTSCRKAIEELQRLWGSNEEERRAFITQILQDEKKAEDYSSLVEVVKKAKNFASGGPHTYWVKTANRRDAELSLRVTCALVSYFAKNMAKQRK